MSHPLLHLASEKIICQRKTILKAADTTNTDVYYIHDGAVQVYINDKTMDQVIRFGYAGDMITALDSYLTALPSPLIIQTIKKSTISIIKKSAIDAYIRQDNNMHIWVKLLENLIVQQMEREVDLLISNPAERYQRVLARSPQLFQSIPHKYIAQYLRMTPETLSRLRKY